MVAVVPVFDVIPYQVKPLVDLSILYPVITEPPLIAGAAQCKVICVDDAVAVSPTGGDDLLTCCTVY